MATKPSKVRVKSQAKVTTATTEVATTEVATTEVATTEVATTELSSLAKAHEDVELVSNELNLAKNLRDYYRTKLLEAEIERIDKPCARRRNKAVKIKIQLDQITRDYARIDYHWDLIHKEYRKKLSRVETNEMNWYHG